MIIMYSFSNNIYMLGLEMIKQLTMLPKPEQLETRAVLKQLVTAHRYLAELKGVASTIPNPEILISTLSLQEAKDSSEIDCSRPTFLLTHPGTPPQRRFDAMPPHSGPDLRKCVVTNLSLSTVSSNFIRH